MRNNGHSVTWQNVAKLISRSYVCGHCGNPLVSQEGYMAVVDLQRIGTIGHELIHLCHFCESPTYFDENGKQFPGSPYGDAVKGIPVKEVEAIYNEARNCISVNAYTGAVLCCRKLLMNISVSKGAKQGLSFIEYVEFLAANSYIPPDAKDWVDHIRKKGNEANHEITIMNREDAEELVSFAEMLLKVIYEFPAAIKNKTTAKKAS